MSEAVAGLNRRRGMALLVAVAAVFALTATQQAVFASPAKAWLTEEECTCAGPGGSWGPADGEGIGDDVGDQESYPWADDGPTQYEVEHEAEIERLDTDIVVDDWQDRAARLAQETADAEEAVTRWEEDEEERQRWLDYMHNETAAERLSREQREVLQRHPHLAAMQEACDDQWNAAVLARQSPQVGIEVLNELITDARDCAASFKKRLRELLPDDAPTDRPRVRRHRRPVYH
jgi:hypothetical protein